MVALRSATLLLTRTPEQMILVGIEPDEPDPELGYILPGQSLRDGSYTVQAFAEKPDLARARELLHAGALWNSFIFAASGPTLLQLLRKRMSDAVDTMETALARDARTGGAKALTECYEQLPSVDFSRCILEGAETHLRLVKALACGWSDLGTPARLAGTLQRLNQNHLSRPLPRPTTGDLFDTPAAINLATRGTHL